MKNIKCILNYKILLKLIYLLIIFLSTLFDKNHVNCKLIQLEDYCLGPICEFLLWKPDQDEINIEKIFYTRKLLYFKNSIIPKLPAEIFTVYPDLKQLSISNAYIEELPENMESNNLEFLYLSVNKLKLIENDAFKSLPNLRYLWLSNNEIEKIDGYAFDNMDNLMFLELSDNEITELSESLFKNAPKLTTLFLSKNKITTLQNGLFDNNPHLYQLNIDRNNLLTIDDNIFKGVKSLNIFDISFNPIKTLNLINANIEKFVSESTHLMKLNIDGNIRQMHFSKTPIKIIELNEPENLETLTLLNCSLRNLSMIESFIKLRILNLSLNPLITLDEESLKHFKYLEILVLQKCDLSLLEIGVFNNLKYLKYLDISHNEIEELYLDTLRPMTNLKNISIAGNHWSCCSLKILIRYFQSRSITFREEPKINQTDGVYLGGINCIV